MTPVAPLRPISDLYRASPLLSSSAAAFVVSNLLVRAYGSLQRHLALTAKAEGRRPLIGDVAAWLVHVLVLSPLALSRFWRISGRYLPTCEDAGGRLVGKLEERRGGRPNVCGLAVQRQVDQEPGRMYTQALETFLQDLAKRHPSHLLSVRPDGEPPSLALCSLTHTLVTHSNAPSRSTRSSAFPSSLARDYLRSMPRGEFCRLHLPSPIHPGDTGEEGGGGLLQVVLHPEDANEVVKRAWGEVHGLAGFPAYSGFWIGSPVFLAKRFERLGRWWWRDGSRVVGGSFGLPPSYTLVYAPRDEEEVDTVKKIVVASVAFATGLRAVET